MVLVDPRFLAAIFGNGTGECVVDEPVEDLTIVSARWDPLQNLLELVVFSASFDPVPAYHVPPTWCPTYRKERDQE